jgi:hypothetical protein
MDDDHLAERLASSVAPNVPLLIEVHYLGPAPGEP